MKGIASVNGHWQSQLLRPMQLLTQNLDLLLLKRIIPIKIKPNLSYANHRVPVISTERSELRNLLFYYL